IQHTPDSEVLHYEFLPQDKDFPVAALLYDLARQIKQDNGSVLVWHDSFEKARNKEMAYYCPEYGELLEDINARIVDMEKVFTIEDSMFLHPQFKGRSSIKKVLPV